MYSNARLTEFISVFFSPVRDRSLALTREDLMFCWFYKLTYIGGGSDLLWKYFNFLSEGQYFKIIFNAIDAEGEYLVIRESLFMFFFDFGLNSKDLSRKLTLLM